MENNDLKIYFLTGSSDINIRNSIRNKVDKGENLIVITTNIWNEGVNLRNLKSIVIAGGMKSFVLTKQRAGRVMRKPELDLDKEAIIIDFYDETNRVLLKHSKKRLKIYQNDSFDIKFIEFKE